MIKIRYFISLLFFSVCFVSYSQQDTSKSHYVKFYYPDGKISSEGYLESNKPNGYWKTYYENGNLKSEGNRKNFELDSVWKFYDENARLNLIIHYSGGKKNGERITYEKNEKIVENFKNDIKEGTSIILYNDGKIKKSAYFSKGLEDGLTREFDENGQVITLYHYKKGILLSRQYINRVNSAGLKTGTWINFWENGKVRTEQNFKNGLLDGYSKEYDEKGNLILVRNYVNGEIQTDDETKEYEILYDYYPDGKKKIVGSYLDGVPNGIRREYSEEGKIVKSYVLKNGKMIGEGIIDEKGYRQGEFKEYYENGAGKSEGKYLNSIKTGDWKYYYPDNTIEQTGKYDTKGRQTGKWIWYYQNGNIWKEEEFKNGKREGRYVEYSAEGKIITEGSYLEDIENGFWFYETGDAREEGNYTDGQYEGIWKITDIETGKLIFEGKYTDGLPDGKHTFFWESGQKKMEGRYIMGQKEGEWAYYDSEGRMFLRVGYKNGIEITYDRVIIETKK